MMVILLEYVINKEQMIKLYLLYMKILEIKMAQNIT